MAAEAAPKGRITWSGSQSVGRDGGRGCKYGGGGGVRFRGQARVQMSPQCERGGEREGRNGWVN